MLILNFKNLFTIGILINTILSCFGQQYNQHVVEGKIDHLESFQSKYVEPRNIDIWLPMAYDGIKKFAVLYMHDGQMLFDSTNTWNKSSWNIDDVCTQLLHKDMINDFIVVGIWNSGQSRHNNYFPQKPFEALSDEDKKIVRTQLSSKKINLEFKPNADDYLKFIVKELKPFIDANYSINTDQASTFIGGSSMGGLISLYAICEYPEIFYGAACISTHWPGTFSVENNPIPQAFYTYLFEKLPDPKNHRIYFDHGTETLDALYPPLQKEVDNIMKIKGYGSLNWMTKQYDGTDHSEKSWHDRLHILLLFLLGKK